MLTKKGIVFCLLTIVMGVYLLVALPVSRTLASNAACRGIEIEVANNALSPFVTADDINHELDSIKLGAYGMPVTSFDLQAIEDRLTALANVESAQCIRLSDNKISIRVVPMVPVARIFDPSGSYYINKDGKRLTANARYQIDAPVIIKERRGGLRPESLVDLLDKIDGKPEWKELVSALKIDANNDILIIPSISGHVINFGSADMAADKFDRLFTFYREVMPVKGWNYYDTISVKFARQVVGKVAPGSRRAHINEYSDEDFEEENDIETMLVESTSAVSDSIIPKI